MVTRQRTPRREKSFFRATKLFIFNETSSGSTSGQDLLSEYKIDEGISQTRNVTVMDIRVRAQVNRKATTTQNNLWDFSCGIGWIPSQLVGTANLPNPGANGSRETRWVHKWDQSVLNDTVAQDRPGDNRFGDPLYIARSKNMAKQPTANHELLVVVTPLFSGTTPDQDVDFGIIVEGMLAID